MHWDHLSDILSGMATLAIISHAVNNFPVPVNKYGSWFLGVIQFAVGQRLQGKSNIQNLASITLTSKKDGEV